MSHSACPKCGSHNCVSQHWAKKFGGMVGMIGGGMSGASGMWASANLTKKSHLKIIQIHTTPMMNRKKHHAQPPSG